MTSSSILFRLQAQLRSDLASHRYYVVASSLETALHAFKAMYKASLVSSIEECGSVLVTKE